MSVIIFIISVIAYLAMVSSLDGTAISAFFPKCDYMAFILSVTNVFHDGHLRSVIANGYMVSSAGKVKVAGCSVSLSITCCYELLK